ASFRISVSKFCKQALCADISAERQYDGATETQHGHTIGRPDKGAVTAHLEEMRHDVASIDSRKRTARAKIVVRMRKVQSVRNNNVYPAAMMKSGHRKMGAMLGPPLRRMLSP